MAYFFAPEDIPFKDHPKYAGVQIAILVNSSQSPQVSISMLEIAPGVEIPIHTHDPQADSIYVIEGSAEAYVNGAWRNVPAGSYIFVPPTEEHGVRNAGDRPLRLFIVHTPPLF